MSAANDVFDCPGATATVSGNAQKFFLNCTFAMADRPTLSWSPIPISATITVATVVQIVNQYDRTRFETIANTQANITQYKPSDTDSAGTRRASISIWDGSQSIETTIAFPTGIEAFGSVYGIKGVISTTTNGSPLCATGDDDNPVMFTLPSEPPPPSIIPKALLGDSDLSQFGADPRGWTYVAVTGNIDRCRRYEAIKPLFPDLGVWSCRVDCASGLIVQKTALYLTHTETSTESSEPSITAEAKITNSPTPRSSSAAQVRLPSTTKSTPTSVTGKDTMKTPPAESLESKPAESRSKSGESSRSVQAGFASSRTTLESSPTAVTEKSTETLPPAESAVSQSTQSRSVSEATLMSTRLGVTSSNANPPSDPPERVSQEPSGIADFITAAFGPPPVSESNSDAPSPSGTSTTPSFSRPQEPSSYTSIDSAKIPSVSTVDSIVSSLARDPISSLETSAINADRASFDKFSTAPESLNPSISSTSIIPPTQTPSYDEKHPKPSVDTPPTAVSDSSIKNPQAGQPHAATIVSLASASGTAPDQTTVIISNGTSVRDGQNGSGVASSSFGGFTGPAYDPTNDERGRQASAICWLVLLVAYSLA